MPCLTQNAHNTSTTLWTTTARLTSSSSTCLRRILSLSFWFFTCFESQALVAQNIVVWKGSRRRFTLLYNYTARQQPFAFNFASNLILPNSLICDPGSPLWCWLYNYIQMKKRMSKMAKIRIKGWRTGENWIDVGKRRVRNSQIGQLLFYLTTAQQHQLSLLSVTLSNACTCLLWARIQTICARYICLTILLWYIKPELAPE